MIIQENMLGVIPRDDTIFILETWAMGGQLVVYQPYAGSNPVVFAPEMLCSNHALASKFKRP